MEQSRRTRKKDMTHRAIMHSAKMLFEKKGIGNVTVDAIAENADVSRSTFFSHFSAVDDLLKQIANEEIDDIIAASVEDGRLDITALFSRLTEDTYPYPYLMSELITRSIISPGNSSVAKVFSLIQDEIAREGYEQPLKEFSSADISAFIFGAYFGLVFQKFLANEDFENPDETTDKLKKFINYIKKQEESTNE